MACCSDIVLQCRDLLIGPPDDNISEEREALEWIGREFVVGQGQQPGISFQGTFSEEKDRPFESVNFSSASSLGGLVQAVMILSNSRVGYIENLDLSAELKGVSLATIRSRRTRVS